METKQKSVGLKDQKKEQAHQESEELNMAVLIALVPALTLSLFVNIGLV